MQGTARGIKPGERDPLHYRPLAVVPASKFEVWKRCSPGPPYATHSTGHAMQGSRMRPPPCWYRSASSCSHCTRTSVKWCVHMDAGSLISSAIDCMRAACDHDWKECRLPPQRCAKRSQCVRTRGGPNACMRAPCVTPMQPMHACMYPLGPPCTTMQPMHACVHTLLSPCTRTGPAGAQAAGRCPHGCSTGVHTRAAGGVGL